VESFINVVTLRRMSEDRAKDPQGHFIDWQWQWTVTGHWRHQYYPSQPVHKRVYIEAYIKGPPDRPLKPPGAKLFVVKR
jgi:hypothetical protein